MRPASSPSLEVPLTFLARGTAQPRVVMSANHADANQRTGDYEQVSVKVSDARSLATPPSLDAEGFALAKHRTSLKDFYNSAEVEKIYYPEMVELLKTATGAAEAYIFDHTLRVEDEAKRRAIGARLPVTITHNDYTEQSGPQRVRNVLPAETAARVLAGRFAIMNVWRSFGESAERYPLAVADGRTVANADHVKVELVYPERIGEVLYTAHASAQRWYYFSALQRDETVVFKCFDSAHDGRTRYTAHTGFANPHAPAGTPARESIEVRAILSFPS